MERGWLLFPSREEAERVMAALKKFKAVKTEFCGFNRRTLSYEVRVSYPSGRKLILGTWYLDKYDPTIRLV